jgi:hypothetical protein
MNLLFGLLLFSRDAMFERLLQPSYGEKKVGVVGPHFSKNGTLIGLAKVRFPQATDKPIARAEQHAVLKSASGELKVCVL